MTTISRDTTVRLAYLTFVEEVDGVMVGRPDNGSYALFPPEGVAAVRRLIDGYTPEEVSSWFTDTYGGGLDLDDFLDTLDELGFVLPAGHPGPAGPPRVRYQRLGKALFSPLAWCVGSVVTVLAIVLMVKDPSLRPSYQNLFFTPHLAVMTVALAVGQIPCVLLHESFHALAGRRLGLPSRLRIGRRYYYVVAETELDALHSVPRRSRYLPFLAGIVADVLLTATLTIAAAAAFSTTWPRWIGGYALAMAFSTLMRILWQALLLPRDRPLLRHSDGHPLHQPASGDASTALHPLAPRHPQTVGSAARGADRTGRARRPVLRPLPRCRVCRLHSDPVLGRPTRTPSGLVDDSRPPHWRRVDAHRPAGRHHRLPHPQRSSDRLAQLRLPP